MSNPKPKLSTSQAPTTRASTSIAGKLAAIAASTSTSSKPRESRASTITMDQLIAELDRQRESLREDMSTLIKASIQPVQSSVDSLRDHRNAFQNCLDHTEALAGENFEKLIAAEATIKSLQAQNSSLLDH